MGKKLTVKKHGGKDILFEQDVLDESIITVGNNPSATLELKDTQIAPEQFVIISENEQMLLMNRADGTIINGELLELGSKIELVEGDKIEIGEFQLFLSGNESNGDIQIEEVVANTEENITIIAENESEKKKDFNSVLTDLKEEDSFYFQIINSENVVERILFDSENIWLGTSFAECAIKKETSELDEIYAYVKKDWSGAVIYPEDSEEILLNGELLTEPSRLKNEDELVLIDDFAEDDIEPTKITFHEPVVLLALNSILPENLPEPISLKSEKLEEINKTKGISFGKTAETETDENKIEVKEKDKLTKKKKRRMFGYFSFLEVLIMAVGTLVTAAIVFLILEFV